MLMDHLTTDAARSIQPTALQFYEYAAAAAARLPMPPWITLLHIAIPQRAFGNDSAALLNFQHTPPLLPMMGAQIGEIGLKTSAATLSSHNHAPPMIFAEVTTSLAIAALAYKLHHNSANHGPQQTQRKHKAQFKEHHQEAQRILNPNSVNQTLHSLSHLGPSGHKQADGQES